MPTYSIPLVPGPVEVPAAVRAAYGTVYASADLEEEFFVLYERCAGDLQALLGSRAQVTIQTGEGMLALWGALKS
ncbi:MAG: alanine--glyoxylate aminotransferase family protein, partial [Caldilinea sp.]